MTVALQLANKGDGWGQAGAYIGMQLLGGILAGFSYFALFGSVFNLAPGKGFFCLCSCDAAGVVIQWCCS